MASPSPVKPVHIALACALAAAVLFGGSILISVAVVKAEHVAPDSAGEPQP
jgi:hypothetical protein